MSKVTFHVARHVPDVIRNEPRNVGVIVSDRERLVARFMGETSPGDLDMRRVHSNVVPDRSLYAEWHRQWRSALASATIEGTRTPHVKHAVAQLVADSTPSFAVQLGGEWYVEAET